MSKKTSRTVWLITYAPRILTGIVGLTIVAALFSSIPQTHLTIEAGTDGGLFDVMSHELEDALEPHGITVDIVNRPDSLRIVDDIVDPSHHVDAGFIASDTPKEDSDLVSQVGTVMLSPVYLITHVDLDVTDITDFAGRTISLYPKGSAAWAACEYVLGSYDIDLLDTNSQYGNGPTIVQNVADGTTDTACFIDVPSGANLQYAEKIIQALSNQDLRFIPIPQAAALQARKDFLRPLTIPSGAFNVFPTRPAVDVPTTGASMTFIAKNSLPRELVTMISHALSDQYRGSTSANQAGELPATNYINLPAFQKARDVNENGLPWLYERFSFRTAAFLDNFISQYGIALTILFLLLTVMDLSGLPLPYELIVGSRPRRMQLVIEAIDRRTQSSGTISKRDQRSLETVEKWLSKETSGLDDLEDRLKKLRTPDQN